MASLLPPARPPSAITLSFSVDSRTLPHEQDKKENMCGCAGEAAGGRLISGIQGYLAHKCVGRTRQRPCAGVRAASLLHTHTHTHTTHFAHSPSLPHAHTPTRAGQEGEHMRVCGLLHGALFLSPPHSFSLRPSFSLAYTHTLSLSLSRCTLSLSHAHTPTRAGQEREHVRVCGLLHGARGPRTLRPRL